MAGCDFEPAKDVQAFAAYKDRLKLKNPEWSPEFLLKQALIVFNEEMYPLQVKSYFAEKNGESGVSTGQTFQIVDGQLVNQHYDFPKMINHATSESEKNSMVGFQDKAVAAKVGEKIRVLDLSALGSGGGVKYLDVYEKGSETAIKHKERIDLSGDGPDLSLEQAEEILAQMDLPENPENPDLPVLNEGLSQIDSSPITPINYWQEPMLPIVPETIMPVIEPVQILPATDTTIIRSIEVANTTETKAVTEPVLNPLTTLTPESELAVPVSEAMGFWFEVMAAAAEAPEIIQKFDLIKVPSIEVPTRLDLEGKKPDKLEKQPTGSHPEGPESTKTVFEVREVAKPVIEKKATPANNQPTRTVLVGEKKDNFNAAVVELSNSSRIIPKAISEAQMVFRRRQSDNTGPQSHRDAIQVLPPVWQPDILPFNEKEVPPFDLAQWVSGGQQDFTIFIIARHYAILYTILVHLSAGRGSGGPPPRVVIYAS